jgi:hypothetical protein
MGLLAVTGNAITLKVRNVDRERRGTEGTTPIHTSLHDDAAMTRKEPAAAECGAASACAFQTIVITDSSRS